MRVSILKHLVPGVATLMVCSTTVTFAGQGVQRMLYTVPNNTFIENPAGDSLETINDTSGSISTLQTLINNASSANPNAIIVIHLLSGATYWVSTTNGLVLGSQECLVGTGATVEATNASVTVPLVTISVGATNVSVAGGTYNGNGADIYGIYAPSSSARVNIDKVTVQNCGQDCIQLNGNGDTTFDNEMTVTRCDASGSPGHSGISLWNATQAVCVDNNCHGNSVGIWLGNCAYCAAVNNTCESNATGIDLNSGNGNSIANNTCNNNGTGILMGPGASKNWVASDSLGSNTTVGISSSGNGDTFADNLFNAGNTVTYNSGGSGENVVAYAGALSAAGQNYFYPPLINNPHTNTIVNGLGRYDLYDSSTGPIDNVQSEYNTAVSANPGDVIVLHLNGSYTVVANPLTLASDTCVLLGGTIQINSSTTTSCAVTAASGASYISISGGTINGGNRTGHNAIYFPSARMAQVDAMTLQDFGTNTTREGGSDIVHYGGGSTPFISTRNHLIGGAARGFWSELHSAQGLYSDNSIAYVNEDGIDCDALTSGALVKFNNSSNNIRDGVFIEQSATYNLAIGNILNGDGCAVEIYNNGQNPPTEWNLAVCNSCLGGGNGMRTGSTGTNSDGSTTTTVHNFVFDDVVQNGSGSGIDGQVTGTQNYYSQCYLAGNSTEITTTSSQVYFNSPDVSGNLYVQDSNSGLDAIVTNAATSNGAAVITGSTTGLGNDEWQLIPTDSGYYRLMNENSGLAMVVLSASTNTGASIIQYAYAGSGNDEWLPQLAGNGFYNFVSRLSGLSLDVTGASTTPGTQLDQQPATGGANQQFNLIDAVLPVPQPTNGTWNTNANANWSASSAWVGGIIANGQNNLALFTNTAVTAARTVTLDTSRTIGNIDFCGTNAYTIASASGSVLTLSNSVGTPAIDVPFFAPGLTESHTISAILAGAQGLTKTSGGFLVLDGANTITGGFTVTGSLRVNLATAFNGNAIVETGSTNGDSIYFNAAGTYSDNCSIIGYGPPETDPDYSHLGAIRFATSGVNLSGAVTLLGNAGITPRSATTGSTISGQITGPYALRFGRTSTSSGANAGILILSNINNNWTGNTTNADGTLKLGAAGVIPSGAGYGNLIMTTPGIEYQSGIAPTIFDLNGYNQTINGLFHDPDVPGDDLTLLVITNSSATAATLTVGNNNASGSYAGLIGGGSLGLTKIGTGTETLSGANTYSGNTTISNGILVVNGSLAADSTVIIAVSGTLAGTGAIGGSVTVNGMISPGLPLTIGTLSVANTVNMQSGGVLYLKINTTNAPATNDMLVADTMRYGGTLMVTNLGPALVVGESFKLFRAANYSGGFTNITPAIPGLNLAWNTNGLTNGILSVMAAPPSSPAFNGLNLNGNDLILSGTNGVPDWTYHVLASTNLMLPLTNWTTVSTNAFDGSGNFRFTNAVNPGVPQVFYLLELP